MLALTILSVVIFLIFLLIFLEYRNEKKYQERRGKNRKKSTQNKKNIPSPTSEKISPKPVHEQKPEAKIKPEPKIEIKPEPKVEAKIEIKPEPKVEAKKLPKVDYPKFTHIRLVEMGLSDEEAKEFVSELIPQIEAQIPLIEKALQEMDFHQMERLTHSIKGSATNLGTGGVSDLLVECNTYLKTGTDANIAKVYFDYLVHYTQELKSQYT